MVNTRHEAGWADVARRGSALTAVMLCVGCTSLEDLSSYSEGSAGAGGFPVFQPPRGGAASEPSPRPSGSGAVATASESQNPAGVPLLPAESDSAGSGNGDDSEDSEDTDPGEDDCAGEEEFTDAEATTCYVILPDADSWREARAGCLEWGGDLARIDSDAENDLLSEQTEGDVWLGAGDFLEEGNFRWIDGEPVDDDGDWAPGQPDNFENREDCLELRSFDDNWNDVPCTSSKRGLCERAIAGATE